MPVGCVFHQQGRNQTSEVSNSLLMGVSEGSSAALGGGFVLPAKSPLPATSVMAGGRRWLMNSFLHPILCLGEAVDPDFWARLLVRSLRKNPQMVVMVGTGGCRTVSGDQIRSCEV